MYPKFLLLSVAVLFAIPLAQAASPWSIGELSATLTFSGDIEVEQSEPGSGLSWVEGSFYIVPQSLPHQSVQMVTVSPEGYSIEQDKFGNNYIKFRWNNPVERTLHYGVVWDVDSNKLKYAITSPGLLGDVPPDISDQYLAADNLTAWTGYIKAKAESLTNGSDSVLEAARRISAWVSSAVKYDLACWKDSFPASTVFATRMGVCDEFTNLFISMCRSIGIPARYVEGLVFSGEKWNFHAWAEVYASGWVPVDPTYNEVGFVDSSHISLAHVYGDVDVYNRLRWEGAKLNLNFGKDNVNVSVSRSSPAGLMDLRVSVMDRLSGLEAAVVNATVTNLANSILVATCSINMPQEMLLLSPDEKSLILNPSESGVMNWTIASPSGLDENWLHRMPLELICFPGAAFNTTITVDPRTEKAPFPRASVTDLTVINSSNALVTITNAGTMKLDGAVVSLCVDIASRCLNQTGVSLRPGEEKEIIFSGLMLAEGDIVSARLYSKEAESASLETRLVGLEKPLASDLSPNGFLSTRLVQQGRNDALVILVVAVVLAVVMLSVFIAVTHRNRVAKH